MTHCRITWIDQDTGNKGHGSTFPMAKEPHINHKVELV